MRFFDKLPLRRNINARNEVSKVLEKNDFQTYQVYPALDDLNPDFMALGSGISKLSIHKQTPIGSMGSCFAREIKEELCRLNFNYVQTENNKFSHHASCSWGRVYSPANAYEILKYTSSQKLDENRFFQTKSGKVIDLIRYRTAYPSLEEAKQDTLNHLACSLKAIQQIQVFILTIGQNEVWFNNKHQYYLSQAPPPELRGDCSLKRLSVEENVSMLTTIYGWLKAIHPEIRLVLTVSPVPSTATYFDKNVVAQSSVNKAILRVAVDLFQEKFPEVVYFPSYEMVMFSREPAFGPDNRHVQRSMVRKIMTAFSGQLTNEP